MTHGFLGELQDGPALTGVVTLSSGLMNLLIR
jgi:hypothetical protein